MLAKINYFLRVYDKFGLLVTLIRTCVKDIIPFSIYLLIWLLTFVILYKLSGIKPPPRDGLSEFFVLLFFVWENSIANINDPDESTFKPEPNSS